MSAEERAKTARLYYEHAKKKLTNRDLAAAEKYLLKAERLYSSAKAKDLLNHVQRARNKETAQTCSNSGQRQMNGKKNVHPQPSSSRDSGSRQRKASYRSAELKYTKEQRDAIMRIAKCKNYYEILEVNVNASDSEIQIAYKKLAKIVHPDKNRAPGATQAFQEVEKAKTTLADRKKRKEYDLQRASEVKSQNEGTSVSTSTATGFDITGIVIVSVAVCAGLLAAFFADRRENRKRQEEEMCQG